MPGKNGSQYGTSTWWDEQKAREQRKLEKQQAEFARARKAKGW